MPAVQEKTVSFSKFRLIVLLIISLSVAAGAAAALVFMAKAATLPREAGLLRALAILFLVGNGLFSLFLFSKLMAGRPALVITAEGFYDSSGGIHSGFIHWNTVEKIEQVRLAGQDFIVVFLSDPFAYLRQQSVSWKRRLLALKNGTVGSPVVISMQGLSCSAAQLRQLLESSHARQV
ncbi:hypothetical protein C7T94_12345 [Pedobacter yulinensis]|uniref:Uncharacterized protein n=1 Tax=Pedobacter yulinensis TaxID=2126353 RepID=A0A2T3HLV1_9SPHI|nr:STM3941 family protein [Pedobacter yulinensis]PST83361.1 hypothetical protein C7T94_12345 [Pedobacter yulinensis]